MKEDKLLEDTNQIEVGMRGAGKRKIIANTVGFCV